jgi:hypothetical protein
LQSILGSVHQILQSGNTGIELNPRPTRKATMTDNSPAADPDAVVRDLQSYNAAFIEANRTDDPSLMRPWMRLPVIRYGPTATVVAATPDEVDAMYGRMVEGLKGTGYDHSVLSQFEVDLVNAGTALVRCRGERLRADGSEVESFDAAYIMARGDDHWQVSALISRR